MSIDFTKLFGGSGAVLGPTLSTNFFTSRTWIAPQDGIVIVRAMGAGGGGATSGSDNASATGGYSGSWGAKILRVKKGDVIDVAIGAEGTTSSSIGDGNAGGNTVVTVGGIQYIAYGGPGGKLKATGPLPNGPSPSANFDSGAASVKPGWVANGRTGGAGVDILAQGNNVTTSASVVYSGGGGTGSPSIGVVGGGAMPNGKSVFGTAENVDASQGEWGGIPFYGGGGNGNNGCGGYGNGSGAGGGGGYGGGGGATGVISGNNSGGPGGIGGGGGGSYVIGGTDARGGQGFAHLKFYADMGV